MAEVSDLVTEQFVAAVAERMPYFVGAIPRPPAATLGRLGAPAEVGSDSREARMRSVRARLARRAQPAGSVQPARGARPAGRPGRVRESDSPEPPALAALRAQDALLLERLLGALELAVVHGSGIQAPDISAHVQPLPDGSAVAFATDSRESTALTGARLADILHPGVADLVDALTRRLAKHPVIRARLTVADDTVDEEAVAAEHGAAYLALAVTVATAVVAQLWTGGAMDPAAAVVGLGVGTAAAMLATAPMPPAYAAALLARIRADYRLPRQTSGSVSVADHRFALVEGPLDERADFSANGLVAVVDGGAVIRAGVPHGRVQIRLAVVADAPTEVEAGWEEVVEVSWHAAEGRASIVGADGETEPQLTRQTPPWPGDYRLRVHARGRDEVDHCCESYLLMVWAAPAAPDVVHRRFDLLGHHLRGEPEPIRPARPEDSYRWIARSALSVAATVTVITGATVGQVVRAFGGDPARSEPIPEDDYSGDWLTVLDVGDAVVAVEINGFQGADATVLRAASAGGRAASMYWNVNALTRLSFAEQGELLASFEPWGDEEVEPAVAAVLTGLDFAELGDRNEKGLVAVERFTGRGLRAEGLARMQETGLGYHLSSR